MQNRLSIFCFINSITKLQPIDDSSIEDNRIRRSSKLEPSEFLALCDHVILFNYGNAAGDLSHAYLDDCYLPDIRTKGIDNEDVPRGERG